MQERAKTAITGELTQSNFDFYHNTFSVKRLAIMIYFRHQNISNRAALQQGVLYKNDISEFNPRHSTD